MLGHHLRLAALSLRRDPWLTALMVLAIGFGIGAAMTSATVFRAMAANPAAHKEGRLFNVQLDHWPAGSPYAKPGEPPKLLTYRDAMALWQARRAPRQVAMYAGEFVVEDGAGGALSALARLTTAEFFAMFEPPFRYGAGWGAAEARSVVLSAALNQRLFDGTDSVGERVRIGGETFTVSGVLDAWHPTPRYYDVTGWPLAAAEDLYLPLVYGIERRQRSAQNNDCWPSFSGTFEQFLESECIWFNFWIEVDSAEQLADYRGFLDDYARGQRRLGRFPQPLNNRLRSVGEWLASQDVVRADTRAQTLLSFAFLAVCLVNMVGLLLAKFLARAREISVHRALGATRGQVFLRYLSEAGAVGLCGAVLGLALTFAGAAAMRALDPQLERAARLDPVMILATVLLALGAALAAGAFPAWRACRLSPGAFLKAD